MKTTFAPETHASFSIADAVRSAGRSFRRAVSDTVCITVATTATATMLAALATANITMIVVSGLAALLAVAAAPMNACRPESDKEGGAL